MMSSLFIFAFILVVAIFVSLIIYYVTNDKDEPNYYEPKKDIEENKKTLEILEKQEEEIRNEKSESADDVSNSLNKLDI